MGFQLAFPWIGAERPCWLSFQHIPRSNPALHASRLIFLKPSQTPLIQSLLCFLPFPTKYKLWCEPHVNLRCEPQNFWAIWLSLNTIRFSWTVLLTVPSYPWTFLSVLSFISICLNVAIFLGSLKISPVKLNHPWSLNLRLFANLTNIWFVYLNRICSAAVLSRAEELFCFVVFSVVPKSCQHLPPASPPKKS